MGSIMQPPVAPPPGTTAGLGSAEAGASVMRSVATTIGTTPITRKTVSAPMRTHSSMWKVPLIRNVSRRACQ